MRRKHSIDFKINVIQEYLNDDLGYHLLSVKHKIDNKLLRTWVNQFKQSGVQGLTAGMTQLTYSKSFKLNVIQYRLTHQLSYRETANVFDIPNASVIAQWQSKYDQYGILGLETKSKGRPSKSMNKKPSKQKQKQSAPLNENEREELDRKTEARGCHSARKKVTILSSRQTNKEIIRAMLELRETGLYMLKELLEAAGIPKSVFKYWNDRLPEAHHKDTKVVQAHQGYCG